jgi:cell division protein FtsL
MVQTKVHKIFQAIQKLVAKLSAQQKALQSENAEVADYGFGNYAISRTFANASYIKVLTTPGLDKETVIQKPQKWIKNNVLAILTGLIPTIAGSFGSMFVFLAGTPQVMKSLGHNAIERFLFQDHMQAIGLSIAVCLTLYYGFSYIYTNYKNFLRQKEVEKTQKLIAEENANLLKISSHYNVMTKLRAYCEELVFIQNLIKTFAD